MGLSSSAVYFFFFGLVGFPSVSPNELFIILVGK